MTPYKENIFHDFEGVAIAPSEILHYFVDERVITVVTRQGIYEYKI